MIARSSRQAPSASPSRKKVRATGQDSWRLPMKSSIAATAAARLEKFNASAVRGHRFAFLGQVGRDFPDSVEDEARE